MWVLGLGVIGGFSSDFGVIFWRFFVVLGGFGGFRCGFGFCCLGTFGFYDLLLVLLGSLGLFCRLGSSFWVFGFVGVPVLHLFVVGLLWVWFSFGYIGRLLRWLDRRYSWFLMPVVALGIGFN